MEAVLAKKWANEARTKVKAKMDEVKRERHIAWKEWVSEQLEAGAGALHRYIKKVLKKANPPRHGS